jgi:hypothetical protein
MDAIKLRVTGLIFYSLALDRASYGTFKHYTQNWHAVFSPEAATAICLLFQLMGTLTCMAQIQQVKNSVGGPFRRAIPETLPVVLLVRAVARLSLLRASWTVRRRR